MRRRSAMHPRPLSSIHPGHLRIAALTAVVVALIVATAPDVALAADPPNFDVPPTPPSGATITVDAGQLVEFPIQASDADAPPGVTQIAVGGSHTCALLDNGAVRCWGSSGSGRLGHGNGFANIGDDETPASAGDVDVGSTVVQITADDFHTCALLDTGAVRCWGAGRRLGYGNTTNIGDNETPASAGDVDVGGTVTQIATGGSHTCALLDTGAVRCWGDGGTGRLGYGNTDTIGDDETPASAGDVNVGGIVTQIAVGGDHTCALLDTGAVRCWGDSDDGRLGYGNTDSIGNNETPASAGDVDVGGTVVQIGAGTGHTQAGGTHTCALLNSGAVRCWGQNTSGQLGYGNTNTIGDDELPFTAGDVVVVDAEVVTLGVTGLPTGAGFAPGPPANPASGTFTWVPTNANVGLHAVAFTAQDSTGLSAAPHTINIEVSPTFADLAVTKSVDDSSPGEGDTVTYTVRVTNNGPDPATGVVVNDVIPSGLTFQSSTPSDGAYSPGTGDWTLASPLAGSGRPCLAHAGDGFGRTRRRLGHNEHGLGRRVRPDRPGCRQ